MTGKVKGFFQRIKKNIGSILTAGLFLIPTPSDRQPLPKKEPAKKQWVIVQKGSNFINNIKTLRSFMKRSAKGQSGVKDTEDKWWRDDKRRFEKEWEAETRLLNKKRAMSQDFDYYKKNNQENEVALPKKTSKKNVPHVPLDSPKHVNTPPIDYSMQLGTSFANDQSTDLNNDEIYQEALLGVTGQKTNLAEAIKGHQLKVVVPDESIVTEDTIKKDEYTAPKIDNTTKGKADLSQLLGQLSRKKKTPSSSKTTVPNRRRRSHDG